MVFVPPARVGMVPARSFPPRALTRTVSVRTLTFLLSVPISRAPILNPAADDPSPLTRAGDEYPSLMSSVAVEELIERAGRALLDAASSPARVILFGSHARGDAHEGSDLDLLVIEREVDDRAAESVRLRRARCKASALRWT